MILQTSIMELTFGIMDVIYICAFFFTIAGGWFTIKNNARRIKTLEKELATFKKVSWAKFDTLTTELNNIKVKIEESKNEILSRITEVLANK